MHSNYCKPVLFFQAEGEGRDYIKYVIAYCLYLQNIQV